MAKRGGGRRARKRRGPAQPGAALAEGTPAASTPEPPRKRPAPPLKRAQRRERPQPKRGSVGFAEQLAALGERPRAPWHPLPLSELLILVGIIAMVVGFARKEAGHATLFAGVGAVMLGTIEFTLREHLSGYKPHTTLLAFLPIALLHAALAVALVAAGAPSPIWAIAPLIVDVPAFAVAFRLLRGRFLDARRERTFELGR